MVERFHFLKDESWGLNVTTDFKITVCNRLSNTKREKKCVQYGYDLMSNVPVTQKFLRLGFRDYIISGKIITMKHRIIVPPFSISLSLSLSLSLLFIKIQ